MISASRVDPLTLTWSSQNGMSASSGLVPAAVRDPAVAVMPPHGLSLEEVVYPPDAELAARASEARAVRTLER